jgi:hypothetical protein
MKDQHMKKLAAIVILISVFDQAAFAQYADSVLSYNAGAGTQAAWRNPATSLGAPTTFIGYQNSDPFNPPYASSDVVSVGVGGSLTVHLATPAKNDPTHPYGLDFLIYGDAGFIITNSDYSGGGITDGTLFGANDSGVTRVSVSVDNLTYFTLDPSNAPIVDTYFPNDSSGDWHLPVNPALGESDFAGLDLNGIRALYHGAGGGTGYDLAWAQDSLGNSVSLSEINYIRVEVLSGKSEVDAFVTVPEPGLAALSAPGLALLWMALRKRK